jgi:hypothetical protein
MPTPMTNVVRVCVRSPIRDQGEGASQATGAVGVLEPPHRREDKPAVTGVSRN